jgi:hypothetical protein
VKAFNLKGFRADFDTELDMLVRNHLRGLENRPREVRARSGAVKKAPTRASRR